MSPPAEALVICDACERPQFSRPEGCVQCGAPLPAPAEKAAATGKDKVLEAFEPFVEGSFGEAGALLLSQKRLEWKPACGSALQPKAYPLAELESVQLRRRPAWEALLFGAPALALAAVVPFAAVRALLFVVASLSALAAFTQHRYALFVRTRKGTDPLGLLVGVGRRRTPRVAQALSVWETLSPELQALGVKVQGP